MRAGTMMGQLGAAAKSTAQATGAVRVRSKEFTGTRAGPSRQAGRQNTMLLNHRRMGYHAHEPNNRECKPV